MFIFTCRPLDSNHPFLQIVEFEGKTELALQALKRNAVRELVRIMLSSSLLDSHTSHHALTNAFLNRWLKC